MSCTNNVYRRKGSKFSKEKERESRHWKSKNEGEKYKYIYVNIFLHKRSFLIQTENDSSVVCFEKEQIKNIIF